MPAHITHGHTLGYGRTQTYSSWMSMMGRCTVKTNIGYPRYGAKGISVCERWRDFRNFLIDMGERPAGLTLDRIDNAKGYEPGNCRWVSHKAQARNRKNNVLLTHDGRTMTIPEWSEETGISIDTIRYRTQRSGWPVARALTRGAASLRPMEAVQMNVQVTLEHGERYGRLTVLKKIQSNRGTRYRCGCICGYGRVLANATQLLKGRVTQCDKCAGKLKPESLHAGPAAKRAA